MKGLFKSIYSGLRKHSTEVLVGSGIAGMAASIIFAIRNTPKMNEELERKRNDEELDFRETDELKVVIKHQFPSIILFVTSAAAIIGADAIHLKRNAALAVIVQTSEVAATQYKTIVERVVDDDTRRRINNEYKEEMEKRHISRPIIISGDRYLILDTFTNTYFEGNIQNVIASANEMNDRIDSECYISMNEWYDELGVDTSGALSVLGWNSTNIGRVSPVFDADIIDGRPVVLMSYKHEPSEGFRNW